MLMSGDLMYNTATLRVDLSRSPGGLARTLHATSRRALGGTPYCRCTHNRWPIASVVARLGESIQKHVEIHIDHATIGRALGAGELRSS